MNSLVDAWRQSNPTDPRSDDELTLLLGDRDDGSFAALPDFADDYQRLATRRQASIELNRPTVGEEFTRGVSRGGSQLAQSGYGAAALGAHAVGWKSAEDAMLAKYLESQKDSAEQDASAVPRVEDVNDFGTGVRFALGKAGELIPQIGEAAVLGAAGALAGSTAAPGPGTVAGGGAGLTAGLVARQSARALLKAGIKDLLAGTVDAASASLVRDQIESIATRKAIQGALLPATERLLATQIKATAANLGGMGANLLNFYGIGSGTIYGDIANREGVDRSDAAKAAAIGGIGSAIANMPLPATVLSRFFPGAGESVARTYIQRLAADAALEIPIGAASETADELVQIAAEKWADPKRRDTGLDDSDLSRLLNAAVVGGAAGAFVAPLSAIPSHVEKMYWPNVDEAQQKKLAAMVVRREIGRVIPGDDADWKNLTAEEQNFVATFSGLPPEKRNQWVSKSKEVNGNGKENEEGQGRQGLLTKTPEETPPAPSVNPLLETAAPATTPTAPAQPNAASKFRAAATAATPTEITPADAALNAKIKEAAAKTNPNPTPDDAAEGAYDKGEVNIGGIPVVIETPKGELRQNKRGGQPWSVIMPATYGDIKGTVGADGDPIDVYVGEKPTSERVWVIDQIDPTTKDFDEHKTFLGFETPEQVLAAYDGSFSDGSGPSRRGRVNEMTRAEFETWLKGDTTKAIHYEKPSEPTVVATPVQPVPAAAATAAQPAAAASVDVLTHKAPGDTTALELMSLSPIEAAAFFDANQARQNATQNDGVLAGMKLTKDDVPNLKRMANQEYEAAKVAIAAQDSIATKGHMGRVAWLNGAIEGANREGPNYQTIAERIAKEAENANRKQSTVEEAGGKPTGPAASVAEGKPSEVQQAAGEVAPRGLLGGETRALKVDDVDLEARGAYGTSKRGKKGAPSIVEPAWFRPSGLEARVPLVTKLLSDLGTPGLKGKQKTKRLTVLLDRQTGEVHIVSTYKHGGPKFTIFSEDVRPKGRGQKKTNQSVDVNTVLDMRMADQTDRFKVIGSMRTKELTEFFHQQLPNEDAFESQYGQTLDAESARVKASASAAEAAVTKTAQTPVVTVDYESSRQERLDIEPDQVQSLADLPAVVEGESPDSYVDRLVDGYKDGTLSPQLRATIADIIGTPQEPGDIYFFQRVAENGLAAELKTYGHEIKPREGGQIEQAANARPAGGVPTDVNNPVRPAPTVASEQNPAGVARPASDTGNEVSDKTSGEVTAPTAPRGNPEAYIDSLFAVVPIPKNPGPAESFVVGISNMVRRALSDVASGETDARKIVDKGTEIARMIGGRISQSFISVANSLLDSRVESLVKEGATDEDISKFRAKINDVGSIIQSTTSGAYVSSPGVERASIYSAKIQLGFVKQAIDALGFGLSDKQKMELYKDVYGFFEKPSSTGQSWNEVAAQKQIPDVNNPTGVDVRQTTPFQGVSDPSQRALLDDIWNAAAQAGIDLRLVAGDKAEGWYQPQGRVMTQVVGAAIGATDVRIAIHEVSHDVFANEQPLLRDRLVAAVRNVADSAIGVDTEPDVRIRQDNPANLPESILQEERLVSAVTSRIIQQGFNPKDAQGYAQKFVRALKDYLMRAALQVQQFFGFPTNEKLALAYFENSVKRLLAGDSPRYSYTDMLRLNTPSVAGRSYRFESSRVPERFSHDVSYDHQPNVDDGATMFNLDNALRYTLPMEGDLNKLRTVRVEREVAALNHLTDLQNAAAAALTADEATAKRLVEEGITPKAWLKKFLKLSDPEKAKATLNGRVDFDGKPIEFNADKRLSDFADASNKDAVIEKSFKDAQAIQYKVDRAIRTAESELEDIKEKRQAVIDRVALNRKNYTDLDAAGAVLKPVIQKEFQNFLDFADGRKRRSAIATQLKVLDAKENPKTYGKAVEALVASKVVTGQNVVQVLDLAANTPAIDFSAKADVIRQKMRESGKFERLVRDDANSRSALALVIAIAKANPRLLAELELRKLKERPEVEAKLDDLLSGKTKPIPKKKIVTRDMPLADRVLYHYSADARKIKDITKNQQDLTNNLRSMKLVEPVVGRRVDELTGLLGVTQDFYFKDGAEYLHAKPGMSTEVALAATAKINLDTTGTPTDPAKLSAHVADMKAFLMEREEQYRNGNLAAKDRAYQRVERQYGEISNNLHYKNDQSPTDRFHLELYLMPAFARIGDAFGTPAAQLFKKAGYHYSRVEAFLRNISDGTYDRDYRIRRDIFKLLPGLNDDNLQSLVNEAKTVIEEKTADLVESYSDDPAKLQRAVYRRVEQELMGSKLAKDIGLPAISGQFMPKLERLIELEHQAEQDYYTGQVLKGIEVVNPITGQYEKAGLKVKDEGLKVMNDNGELVPSIRRHVAKGWRTFGGRRMSGGFNQMVRSMRLSDWASFRNWVGDGKLAAEYSADVDAARTNINRFFENSQHGDVVKNWFMQMLVDQGESFDAPPLEDGVTVPPADPQKVRQAWDEADGDALAFAENMYALHDGQSDLPAYIQSVADQLGKYWEEVDRIDRKYFPTDGEVNPMTALKGMSPNALVDAREIAHLPGQWFSFYKFDKPNLHRLSRQIAAEVSFGRNSEYLSSLMDTVANEVKDASQALENERMRLRTINPNWTAKRIENEVEKLADYKRLKTFDERAGLIKQTITEISGFFRKDNSPEATIQAGTRVAQMLSRLMVNNPASAIYQNAALFDQLFRYGLTGETLKATGAAIKRSLEESVASIAQSLGVQMYNDDFNNRFNQLGLQYSERVKKFGDEFRRWDNETVASYGARMVEEMVSTPINLRGKEASHVLFRPTGLFDWTTMVADRALTDGMWKFAGGHAARGIEFYRSHPELLADPTYKLTAKDVGATLPGAASAFNQLAADMGNFGMDFDSVVRGSIKRSDGRVFAPEEELRLNAMAMSLVSSQSNLATMTPAAWNNNVVRWMIPLLGWMWRRTMDVTGKRLGADGKLQATALLRGTVALAAATVGGLAVSAMVDKYYEELVGRKRNLRPILTGGGMIEHIARTGSTGFLGELANGMLNVGTGGDSRVISLDRRVVAMSAFMSFQNAIANLINQQEFDYARVGRPLFTAIGGNSMLQYMGMANNMFALDNVEARISNRINAQNYLRVVGRQLNMQVREFRGGGTTSATPLTPYLSRMELAAYANNAADFREAYNEAIIKAKEMGNEDPTDHVKRAFAAKNPLRSVFQTAPSESEYNRLLIAMPEDGRAAVTSAVNNFNRYAESIGAKAFDGKAEKKQSSKNPFVNNVNRFRAAAFAR
jgi:hypothetical protein